MIVGWQDFGVGPLPQYCPSIMKWSTQSKDQMKKKARQTTQIPPMIVGWQDFGWPTPSILSISHEVVHPDKVPDKEKALADNPDASNRESSERKSKNVVLTQCLNTVHNELCLPRRNPKKKTREMVAGPVPQYCP
jgi:hypothetical protein